MLTIDPELRPYSALKVELSILNSSIGVDGRLEGDLVLIRIAQIDAVDHEVDAIFTGARGVEREGSLPAQRRGEKSIGRRSNGARSEHRKGR